MNMLVPRFTQRRFSTSNERWQTNIKWEACERKQRPCPTLNIAVSWDVAPCSVVEIGRRFRGAYWLHHQDEETQVKDETHRPDAGCCKHLWNVGRGAVLQWTVTLILVVLSNWNLTRPTLMHSPAGLMKSREYFRRAENRAQGISGGEKLPLNCEVWWNDRFMFCTFSFYRAFCILRPLNTAATFMNTGYKTCVVVTGRALCLKLRTATINYTAGVFVVRLFL
jgi:hypothetical protein